MKAFWCNVGIIILHSSETTSLLFCFPLYLVKIFRGSNRWYCSSQISYFLSGCWRRVTEFYFKFGDCGLLFYIWYFKFRKEINPNDSRFSDWTIQNTYKLQFAENTKLNGYDEDDEIIFWQGRFCIAFPRTEEGVNLAIRRRQNKAGEFVR